MTLSFRCYSSLKVQFINGKHPSIRSLQNSWPCYHSDGQENAIPHLSLHRTGDVISIMMLTVAMLSSVFGEVQRRVSADLGCACASVKTATVVQTKQRQATLRDQCVDASSMLNSTPPMGAPNAACIAACNPVIPIATVYRAQGARLRRKPLILDQGSDTSE